ncbi:mannose-1-phosphate guanylyltransferase [Paenibacillus tarimensis]
MKAVIMAGGKGTRFWPRSTEAKPKQFLSLTTPNETMIQQTYMRFASWMPESSIYIVTTRQYLEIIREQLPRLAHDRIILEPEQRDTGPCIAFTALHFLRQSDDEVLVVSPSDHYISNGEALRKALIEAEKTARAGHNIVTLGIVPTRPETGYGYIEVEEDAREETPTRVKSFIEKPSKEKADHLFKRKDVFWNSGMFVWKPSTIAHYMKLHQERMWELLSYSGKNIESAYLSLPKISIDYAILEKADHIYVIPVSFDWDDVGSWTSLERIHDPTEEGNMMIGDVHAAFTNNSIIYSEKIQTVVIGAQDLIIVSTLDGLLICHKSKEQQIKNALEVIQQNKGGS